MNSEAAIQQTAAAVRPEGTAPDLAVAPRPGDAKPGEPEPSAPGQGPPPAAAALLSPSVAGLAAHEQKAESLRAALVRLARVGDETIRTRAVQLRRQLDAFEPAVTLIGQVKAGKTSLINAMIGWPDLLPTDVNPWTSVVTSLHMSPAPLPEGNRARFRFFDEEEWARLLDRGGRMGEMASRAGADAELEKVRRQIEAMRDRARERLGRRFEMLLGQEHDYTSFDRELIERYVCLGDDFGDAAGAEEGDSQGRFADITRAAALHFHHPAFPTRLCIRDTPGVNDTFLMREQVTIRAIRGSRLCVLVLSAHQALSSVDMALIRLISNIRAREVVIFVNRIDELPQPSRQVEEIRDSIRHTLSQHEGPAGARIIFGSAYWAGKALSGDLDALSRDSAGALLDWAEQALEPADEPQSPAQMIWALSGVGTLMTELADRIAESQGREIIDKVARKIRNMAESMQADERVIWLRRKAPDRELPDRRTLERRLDAIAIRAAQDLEARFDRLQEEFSLRLERAHRSFLDRATAALIAHLEANGEKALWQYDPAGLRVLLRSGYRLFGARAQSAAGEVYEAAAREMTELFASCFGHLGNALRIAPPAPPRVPPPVFLGQTIALDLQVSWWKSWWQKRRGYRSLAAEFQEMIRAETAPVVEELGTGQATALRREARALLDEFLNEQRALLGRLGDSARSGEGTLDDAFATAAQEERRSAVQDTLDTLNRYVG